MENHEIIAVLQKALTLQHLNVTGDGSHFHIIAVSEAFSSLNQVKRQQLIYAPLMTYITQNRIHAVSIKAYTPNEWLRDKKLNGF